MYRIDRHASDSLARYRVSQMYAQQAFDYLMVSFVGAYATLTLLCMGESVDAIIAQARDNLTEEGRSSTHHVEGQHQNEAMIIVLSAMKEVCILLCAVVSCFVCSHD